ncbi:MAG: hypothetical protein IJ196_01085 [Prevotella sp.]|nr:hypothetical protein [Prevotella sp.]
MKRLLTALLLVVALMPQLSTEAPCPISPEEHALPALLQDECRPSSLAKETRNLPEEVRLGAPSAPDRQAIISQSPSIPNLVSTRTQRVMPSQASKNNRLAGRIVACYKQRKTLSNSFDGRVGRLAAPFQSRVSCAYFVIALRHIIR